MLCARRSAHPWGPEFRGAIWYRRNDGAHYVYADGLGEGRGLAYGGGWAASPDGMWMATVSFHQVWVGRVDGQVQYKLGGDASEGPCPADPRWSPDGRWLAFWEEPLPAMYVCAGDCTGLGHLAAGSPGEYPTWAPDGRLVYVVGDQLFVVNQDGTGLGPITQPSGPSASYPCVSPDGTQIACVVYPSRLCLVGFDGSNRRTLQPDDRVLGAPAWSPDGTQLAYIRRLTYTLCQLVVVNADGSDASVLVHDRDLEGVCWVAPAASPAP